MIIADISMHKANGLVSAEASIIWENAVRPTYRLYFQTSEEYADIFWADPNAFLMACYLPAYHLGEKRIRVEGAICPLLHQHLKGAMMLVKSWYPDDFNIQPLIEPAEGFKALMPFGSRSLSLLSGGIDSLSILRANHLLLPADHPDFIKGTLSVSHYGKKAETLDEYTEHIKGRMEIALPLAKDANLLPIFVLTNVWRFNPSGYFYDFKAHGAQLSAAASFFSKGFNKGFIASSFDAAYLHKYWGSHPLLDSYYSSNHFKMEHTGTEMNRLEKTEIVANWPAALQHVRVCQKEHSGELNCGTCEKCIRTMTHLEALGMLRNCKSFPENNIDAERINYLEKYKMLFDVEQIYLYKLSLPLLTQNGREDLVTALKGVFSAFYKRKDIHTV
jgi:hypothetical protein